MGCFFGKLKGYTVVAYLISEGGLGVVCCGRSNAFVRFSLRIYKLRAVTIIRQPVPSFLDSSRGGAFDGSLVLAKFALRISPII
jgi:hypothetical protein